MDLSYDTLMQSCCDQQQLVYTHRVLITAVQGSWLRQKRLINATQLACDSLGVAGLIRKWWMKLWQKRGTPPKKPQVAQRYYPQCITCCQKQSTAVKMNRRTLVRHMGGPKPWHLAGSPPFKLHSLAQDMLPCLQCLSPVLAVVWC